MGTMTARTRFAAWTAKLVYICRVQSCRQADLVLMIPRHLNRCALLGASLALVLIDPGCASTATSSSEDAADVRSSGGTSSTDTANPGASRSLTFDTASISIPVLSQIDIPVRVAPAQGQVVTFALVGKSLDASLHAAQVTTDATGLASVTLTAPSTPTSFALRASIDRSTVAEMPVVVTPATTGTLDVSAQYTGNRRVEVYSIRVFSNEDCSVASVAATLDTPISVTTNSLPIRVQNIPLGIPLAVVVEGDQTTVRGCAALRGVTGASTVAVDVPLEDRPLDLYRQSLDIAMSATDNLAALQDSLRTSIPTFLSAFMPGEHDLVDLVAEMQACATGSLQQEFANLRLSSNWDNLVVSTHASVGGVDLLRRQLRGWLSQGIALLSRQPSFEVHLELGTEDYSTPRLSLVRIAGLDAVTALSIQSSNLALNVESDDRLDWSSTLNFSKSILVDGLAFMAASTELVTGANVAAQLATRLDCDTFASTLDNNAVWSNANSRVCGASCLATLCRDALDAMYTRARATTFGTPTTPLFLNASGTVTVNAKAQPAAIAGTWIGVWSAEDSAVALSGICASQ